MTGGRILNRLATPRAAVGALLLALVGTALTFVVVLAGHVHAVGGTAAVWVLAFSLVGSLLAIRRPDHLIGWLFLGVGVFGVLNGLGSAYNVLDFRLRHGSVPLGGVSLYLQLGWAPAITLIAICVMVFPDGHPSGRATRWALRLLLLFALAWAVGAYGIVTTSIVEHHIRVTATGDPYQIDHPSGAWSWWSIAQAAFFLVLGAACLVWVVDAVRRYRRAQAEARAQEKWLFAGVVVAVTGGLLSIFGPPAAQIALAALPVTVAVAILKFHLYDIDRIVSRTIAYALLTATVAAVYVGLVTLATQVLPFSSEVGVAAATLSAAALFNPLRHRLQRLVDRRFNRVRYDADAMIEAFAGRLRDAVGLDAVRADYVDTLAHAVEPSTIGVWLAPSGRRTGP